MRRRQAVEPVIGRLKSDGPMGRNWLKGTEGGRMNVMLACAGHNPRVILRKPRGIPCAWIPEGPKCPFMNFPSEIFRHEGRQSGDRNRADEAFRPEFAPAFA